MVGRFTPAAIICKIYCKVKDGMPNNLSRRELLGILGAGACTPFSRLLFSLPAPDQKPSTAARPPVATSLAPGDDQFLDDLEKANFQYFWEQASPQTGLVKDRSERPGQRSRHRRQYRGHRVRTNRTLHWGAAWLRSHPTGPPARDCDLDLSVEKTAKPSWIFLSLGEHKHRRKSMGLGSVLGRHRHSALRSSDLPAAFSAA